MANLTDLTPQKMTEKIASSLNEVQVSFSKLAKHVFNNKSYVFLAILCIGLVLGISYGLDYWKGKQYTAALNKYQTQVTALQAQIKVKEQQLKEIQAKNDTLIKQFKILQEQQAQLEAMNDAKVKEAEKNAYKKVMSLRDIDILDYYNHVYRPGVVQRNAVRQRQYSNSD